MDPGLRTPEDRVMKVLVFGETGGGKSTIANMLVEGELKANPLFPVGNDMKSVTQSFESHSGRHYEVFDTIRLGRGTAVQGAEDIVEQISQLLSDVQTGFSHILFVKKAGRSDTLDEKLFGYFKSLFRDEEDAFGVVITKVGSNWEQWKESNKSDLRSLFGELAEERIVLVEFPALDDELEAVHVKRRENSLARLETFLHLSFQKNQYKYYKPQLKKDPIKRAREFLTTVLRDIWEYVKQFTCGYAQKALKFFTTVMRAFGIIFSEKLATEFVKVTSLEDLYTKICGREELVNLVVD